MITEKSKSMMVKSFKKTTYRFDKAPTTTFENNYGVYVHVPFCKTKCHFCPFYKEIYKPGLKDRYLEALISEISNKDIKGKPLWLYFGGGTPNLLSIEEIDSILTAFRSKIEINEAGIELLPGILTDEYLRGLKKIGFTKISIGIESLQQSVLDNVGRENAGREKIKEIITTALELGMWVNVDMMLGLPGQKKEQFIEDIAFLSSLKPSQITTYPYMVIGDLSAQPSMPDKEQYKLIEEASSLLLSSGFTRKGIWIFARGSDIYDTSRDELIVDYAGFGPAAFSTYDRWKVVNPDLETYLKNFDKNRDLAFVAEKTPASDEWRNFARMIYDLNCYVTGKHSFPVNMFTSILKLMGYARGRSLSEKGIYFAHDITKAVVESLPFPIQNSSIIENFEEYRLDHTN